MQANISDIVLQQEIGRLRAMGYEAWVSYYDKPVNDLLFSIYTGNEILILTGISFSPDRISTINQRNIIALASGVAYKETEIANMVFLNGFVARANLTGIIKPADNMIVLNPDHYAMNLHFLKITPVKK